MEKNIVIPANVLVSVVIPVFNGSNYLREAIESVFSQTYKNIELIVVNDGSQDNQETENIAKSYGNRIKYLYQENSGVSVALNNGIKNSKGEWIAWLSHDDCFLPNKIEAQLNKLYENPGYSVCYSDYYVIDKDGKCQGQIDLPFYDSKIFTNHLLQAMFVCGSTVLIRKNCFDTIGFFDQSLKFAQDADFWIRVSMKFKFIHCSEKLINWRYHSTQGSRNFNLMKKDKFNYLFKVVSTIPLIYFFRDQSNLLNFSGKAWYKLGLIMLKCHRDPKLASLLFKKSLSSWFSIKNKAIYYLIYLYIFGFVYYSIATYLAFQFRKISRKNLKVPVVNFFVASNKVDLNL